MPATPEERAEFAAALRTLIKTKDGMDNTVLAKLCGVTPQAVGKWLAADSTPKRRATVELIEDTFGVPGQLLDILGLTESTDSWRAAIEARVTRIEAHLGLERESPPAPPVRGSQATGVVPRGTTPGMQPAQIEGAAPRPQDHSGSRRKRPGRS